jgi:phosphoribosylanthranilate isomerase
MKFLIKICGVTRPEDAAFAAKLGAGAIGINFWPSSKRFVDHSRAKEILKAIPADVLKVGVFVNAQPEVVNETACELKLDRVQLHGDERAATWTNLPRSRIIRAVRVQDRTSLDGVEEWQGALVIYDAFVEGYGGGGQTAPWHLLQEAPRPFLLAGGLTPDNVADAIHATRPDGVDVASGVESKPGIKDPDKLRAFIENAREAAQILKGRL